MQSDLWSNDSGSHHQHVMSGASVKLRAEPGCLHALLKQMFLFGMKLHQSKGQYVHRGHRRVIIHICRLDI